MFAVDTCLEIDRDPISSKLRVSKAVTTDARYDDINLTLGPLQNW